MTTNRPTQDTVVALAFTLSRDAISALIKKASDRTEPLKRAYDLAIDEETRLWFASRVLDALREHPQAVTISVIDWEDEVDSGQPFDVALHEVFDANGNPIADIDYGGTDVRHHWVLDTLRDDPDAADGNTSHPGHRISVAKTVAWLADKTVSPN